MLEENGTEISHIEVELNVVVDTLSRLEIQRVTLAEVEAEELPPFHFDRIKELQSICPDFQNKLKRKINSVKNKIK